MTLTFAVGMGPDPPGMGLHVDTTAHFSRFCSFYYGLLFVCLFFVTFVLCLHLQGGCEFDLSVQ